MLAAGVRRVLIANEVTDPPAVRWIAAQLRDPGVEILCAVDSPPGVELLAEGMRGSAPPAPRPRGARPSGRAHRMPHGSMRRSKWPAS